MEGKRFNTEFDLSNYSDVDELIAACEKHKYQILVVDSLQNLYSTTDHNGNDLNAKPGSNTQAEVCIQKLASYAKRTLTTIFCINHSTKGGDFKGSTGVEHAVDGTISLQKAINEDADAAPGDRILELRKNRWGLTNVEFYLTMTEHGLAAVDRPEPEVQERQASGRKNAGVKGIARQMLADNLGCTRDRFIEMLVAKTDCRRETAAMYWGMLRRERIL